MSESGAPKAHTRGPVCPITPSSCGHRVGPNWPTSGEIDIIEGVDLQDAVSTTLHTDAGCDQSGEDLALFSGSWAPGADGTSAADNCDVNAAGQYSNQGCGIVGSAGSMGASFNAGGGGTYATEWVPGSHVAMWFWASGAEPASDAGGPTGALPAPSSWGKPYAYFTLSSASSDDGSVGEGACPSSHFANQSLVFDLTFCGDWDGATYGPNCAAEMAANGWPASCADFVNGYPDAFEEAYWEVDRVAVYSQN